MNFHSSPNKSKTVETVERSFQKKKEMQMRMLEKNVVAQFWGIMYHDRKQYLKNFMLFFVTR